jgi:hypothetical protein
MTGHSGFIAAALFAGAITTTGCSNSDNAARSTAAKPDTGPPKAEATSYVRDAPLVPPAPPKPITFRDGEAAYHAGNFTEATAMFTRLTEEKPGNAWGHLMLGLSASKSGDVTTAKRCESTRIT